MTMAEMIVQGSWVEIHNVILEAGERAPNIPADTQNTALEMRVKGFLVDDAQLGETVEIVTAAGRKLSGRLFDVNPAYTHGFGAPIPELSHIGQQVRSLLTTEGNGE